MNRLRVRSFRPVLGAALLAPVVFLSGCAGHYQVTDPASGKVFYTRDVDRSKREGYIEFTDQASGAEITLQSSEVKKISKDEYNAAVGKGK